MFFVVLCGTVLHCVVLLCAVLCCVVLCCGPGHRGLDGEVGVSRVSWWASGVAGSEKQGYCLPGESRKLL